MFRSKLGLFLGLAAASGIFFAQEASARGVMMIGQTRLSPSQDFDAINTGFQCGRPTAPRFEAVKIRVLRRGANIDSLRVRYGNGAVDNLPVRQRFAPGTESRWIDLVGGDRCITAIYVSGDARGFAGRDAIVQVFGMNR